MQRATTALTLLAEDDSERAMSRFVLGMVVSNRWQWAEAETHHRAALALRQAQGNARRTAWALQNVGYALQGQQRYAEALEYFRAADVVLEELGDKANRAIVLMNLARTCKRRGVRLIVCGLTHQPLDMARRCGFADGLTDESWQPDLASALAVATATPSSPSHDPASAPAG